jgi:nucleoid-associated protein EbfC
MTKTPDLNELMEKAKSMQNVLQDVQEKLKRYEVTGESGAGLIKVTMTGDFRAKKTILSPDLKGEQREVIEDLICAAINDAIRKIQEYHENEMGKLGNSLGLPQGGF